MIIYTRTQKSKPRKIPKTQQSEYEVWLNSVNSLSTGFSKKKAKPVKMVSLPTPKPYIRETKKYNSVDTGVGNATKSTPKVYTGDKILGIATMHKSNAVPVFNSEQAKDISSMRR
jgi:hypothetical protein